MSSRITPNARRYASRIAQVYATRLPWLADDIEGAAMLGLTQAAARFRPESGDFTCFARMRIVGAIQDELRLHDPLSTPDRRKVKLGMADPVDMVSYNPEFHERGAEDDPSTRLDLEVLVAALPDRLRRAVRWHFFHGTKLEEVGRRLRVTESRACQLIQEAVRRLRLEFS